MSLSEGHRDLLGRCGGGCEGREYVGGGGGGRVWGEVPPVGGGAQVGNYCKLLTTVKTPN